MREKKLRRGASLRGQGTPALFLHASAVSEQENCGGLENRKTLFRSGFVTTTSSTRGL